MIVVCVCVDRVYGNVHASSSQVGWSRAHRPQYTVTARDTFTLTLPPSSRYGLFPNLHCQATCNTPHTPENFARSDGHQRSRCGRRTTRSKATATLRGVVMARNQGDCPFGYPFCYPRPLPRADPFTPVVYLSLLRPKNLCFFFSFSPPAPGASFVSFAELFACTGLCTTGAGDPPPLRLMLPICCGKLCCCLCC